MVCYGHESHPFPIDLHHLSSFSNPVALWAYTRVLRTESLPSALGSDPHIHMEIQDSGEIRLECTSAGWYPEPQMEWRTSQGEKLASASESMNADEEGLFTVAASMVIRDISLRNISCCIRNSLLDQEKEAGIAVPGQCTHCCFPCYTAWDNCPERTPLHSCLLFPPRSFSC